MGMALRSNMYDILQLSPQILHDRRTWRAIVHTKEMSSKLKKALESMVEAGINKLEKG